MKKLYSDIVDFLKNEDNIVKLDTKLDKILFIRCFVTLCLGILVFLWGIICFIPALICVIIHDLQPLFNFINRKKRIRFVKQCVKDYEEILNMESTLYLDTSVTLNYPNVRELIKHLTYPWIGFMSNDTYYSNIKTIQCSRQNYRRSLGDIYKVCKHYIPTCTLEDIIRVLIDKEILNSQKCSQIKKQVFYHNHISNTNHFKETLEWNDKLTWQDIINTYKK